MQTYLVSWIQVRVISIRSNAIWIDEHSCNVSTDGRDLFGDLSFVSIYIDDVAIGSKSLKDHVKYISIMCERTSQSSLKLKLRKCFFGSYGGECSRSCGIERGHNHGSFKDRAYREARMPQSKKELHSILML